MICCDDESLQDRFNTGMCELVTEGCGADQAIYLLFTCLLDGNAEALERIEEEIVRMEEKTVTKNPPDVTAEIIALRKKLLTSERYYTAMVDLIQEMTENNNDFISEQISHRFTLYVGRVNRYADAVSHLKDYLTQVRDAYQNQIDIGLNEIMKVFTVITAVFLPLSLIAGWYGMNFAMPEYSSPGGYPIVIVVSICVVIGCIVYFKKRKWF